MIVVTLTTPHISIDGAKKCGILNQSPSNCYDHIANLGKLFISGKLSLEDLLKNFKANTNISDGTLSKRNGKNIYAAKTFKNHSKGCYGIYQDILLTVRRYKGVNTDYLEAMYREIKQNDGSTYNYFMDKVAIHYYSEYQNPEKIEQNIEQDNRIWIPNGSSRDNG